MELVLMLVVGVALGVAIRGLIKPEIIGVLRLDQSDPDSPCLFLEMETDAMQKIKHRRYVTMEVLIKDYLSRD